MHAEFAHWFPIQPSLTFSMDFLKNTVLNLLKETLHFQRLRQSELAWSPYFSAPL